MTLIFIDNFFSSNIMEAIASTILHSLWQAPLIALITLYGLKKYEQRNASIRYNIAFSSIILIGFASVFTFLYYYLKTTVTLIPDGNTASFLISESVTTLQYSTEHNGTATAWFSWIEYSSYRIIYTWMIGVFLFSMRLVSGVWNINKVKSSLDFNVPEKYILALQKVKRDSGLKHKVRIAFSKTITIPMVMGHIKPIIVMPFATINNLSLSEAESIMAHEIGHIIRNDYIQNILVICFESLFFYNPAVWWICHVIKTERENSCDELVVKLYPNRMNYAKTLLKLQELSLNQKTSLAMYLFKNQKNLLNRIKRILNQHNPNYYLKERSMTFILLLIGLTTFSSAHHIINQEELFMDNGENELINSTISAQEEFENYTDLSISHSIPAESKKEYKEHIIPKLRYSPIAISSVTSKISKAEFILPLRDTIDEEEMRMMFHEIEERNKANIQELEEKQKAMQIQYEQQLKKLEMQIEKVQSKRSHDKEGEITELGESFKKRIAEFDFDKMAERISMQMEETFDEDWILNLENAGERLEMRLEDMNLNINEDMATIVNEDFIQEMSEFGIAISKIVTETMDENMIEDIREMGVAIGEEVKNNKNLRLHLDQNDRFDLKEILQNELINDSYWKKGKKNDFTITNDYMKVNGKKVEAKIFNKYKRIVKSSMGDAFENKTKIVYKVKGNTKSSMSISIED